MTLSASGTLSDPLSEPESGSARTLTSNNRIAPARFVSGEPRTLGSKSTPPPRSPKVSLAPQCGDHTVWSTPPKVPQALGQGQLSTTRAPRSAELSSLESSACRRAPLPPCLGPGAPPRFPWAGGEPPRFPWTIGPRAHQAPSISLGHRTPVPIERHRSGAAQCAPRRGAAADDVAASPCGSDEAPWPPASPPEAPVNGP